MKKKRIYKIAYVPASKLSDEMKSKYNIKANEYAKIMVTDKGIEIKGVKSPTEEARKAFKKKNIRLEL